MRDSKNPQIRLSSHTAEGYACYAASNHAAAADGFDNAVCCKLNDAACYGGQCTHCQYCTPQMLQLQISEKYQA
jgi:hypothetical protein